MSKNNGKQFLEGDLLGSQHMTEQEEEKLQRSLTNRHIQMIAIGGAIGTGLFMGALLQIVGGVEPTDSEQN